MKLQCGKRRLNALVEPEVYDLVQERSQMLAIRANLLVEEALIQAMREWVSTDVFLRSVQRRANGRKQKR